MPAIFGLESTCVFDIEIISGLATTRLLEKLRHSKFRLEDYRLVVIHVGTNDIDQGPKNKER